MREQFDTYYTAFKKIQNEKEKILELIKDAKAQNAINIRDKLQTLLEEQRLEERTLNLTRRMFYNRLKVLELIEDD
jgi:ERCC4-type nuclease